MVHAILRVKTQLKRLFGLSWLAIFWILEKLKM
jgi:hypothetical protein